MIICPELDDYRTHLEDRKKRQSEGGKHGASITNGQRKSQKNRNDDSSGSSRDSCECLVKHSTDQLSPNQTLKVGDGYRECEAWNEWNQSDQNNANDYEKASNGF